MAKIALFILLATVICGYFVEATVVKDDDDDIDASPEGDGGWGKYNDGDCGKGCHSVNCENKENGVIVANAKCSTIAQNLEVKNINAFLEIIALVLDSSCSNEGNCGKCSGLLGITDVTALLSVLFPAGNKNEGAVCCANSGWRGGNNKFTDCSKKNNACSNSCTSQSSGSGSRGSDCSTNCCTFNCNPSKRLI